MTAFAAVLCFAFGVPAVHAQPVPDLPADLRPAVPIGPPPAGLALPESWSRFGDALVMPPSEMSPSAVRQLEAFAAAPDGYPGDPVPVVTVFWLITDDLYDLGYTVQHGRDSLTAVERAFRDSGVEVRFRFAGGVPYRFRLAIAGEPGPWVREVDGWTLEEVFAALVLYRLADNPLGWVLQPGGARDQLGADIVFVQTRYRASTRAGRFCGVALTGLSPDFPVAAGTVQEACPGLTLAHEIGHVMGLWHDRYTVHRQLVDQGVSAADAHAFLRRFGAGVLTPPAYVFGYLNCTTGQASIMAYNHMCARRGLPQAQYHVEFSNPRRGFGVPGVAPSGRWVGPADAVRRLSELAGAVAGFRRSLR